MSNRRFRLERLEAKGWRGIRDPLSIPLDKPLNIIYGPNGSGKSSILTAIEWALFPAESQKLKEHQIDERRHWEIGHVHGRVRPSVTLVLSSGGKPVTIQQPGAPPELPITARYADFKSLAFLHQETLRDFLIGAPGPRQTAFQRLLGVGWAQDLAKVFADAAKDLDVNAADVFVSRMEEQLHTRILEARRQAELLERDARAEGMEPPWEPLEAKLSQSVASLRGVVPPVHAEAARRKVKLEALRSAWIATVELARQAGDALEPGPETFDDALRRAEALRQQIRAGIADLDRHAALLQDTLAHLRQHSEAEECPVCRHPVAAAALVSDIESRIASTLSADEAALRAKLEQAEAELRQVNIARAAAVERRAAKARADQALARVRGELESALGRAFTAAEDPAAVTARELARLEADVARQQQAVSSMQQRLAAAEKEAARLDLVRRLIVSAGRVRQLESLRETPAWGALAEAHRRLAVRELMLDHASAAVKQHAAELAANNLHRAKAPIAYIYSQLTRRKDFPDAVIDPANKFDIAISGPAGSHAAGGILNLTDLNCLALAVTAGMAVAFPEAHDLEFLVLDDPSQSMDSTVAQRLAPILARLAGKLQIVVATPDPVLLDALRRTAVYKNIVMLDPRDPNDEHPTVRIAGLEQ